MSSCLNSTDRETYLPVLWEVLLCKIDMEWKQKYANLGSSRASFKLNMQLADVIHLDMLAELMVGNAVGKTVPEAAVIYQYLINQQLPTDISADHLGSLLGYCGYQTWQEFKEDALPDDSPASIEFAAKKKGNSFRDPLNYLGPIVLLLIIAG